MANLKHATLQRADKAAAFMALENAPAESNPQPRDAIGPDRIGAPTAIFG